MAAITTDHDPVRAAGDLIDGTVKASETIYGGTLAVYATTGYVESLTDASSKYFAGVTRDRVVGNAAGTSHVDLWTNGEFEFTAASAGISWEGKTLFGVFNSTVGLYATPTNKIPVGKCTHVVSATKVRVKIDGYACGPHNAYGDS